VGGAVVRRLALGISTCPNDTFAFHALMAGESAGFGLEFDVTLTDVEELNRLALAGRFDVVKVSFAAALAGVHRWVVLHSGAALGSGVGPVVLTSRAELAARAAPATTAAGWTWPGCGPAGPRVLAPGEHTTAHLLWRLFHPEPARIEQRMFSAILPALVRSEAELGVCIHEARFTYPAHGLHLVEDLGATWERSTGALLPLGGLVAARALGADVIERVGRAVRASLEWGLAHRGETLATMRRHAQVQDDATIWQHVDLYVNEHTIEIGAAGMRALSVLALHARERGLLSRAGAELEFA
jgi:1,4-dihydroxy-6-naphthoate synthase